MVVNHEQIQFHQKQEVDERPPNQARALYIRRKTLWMGMLFRVVISTRPTLETLLTIKL